MGQPFDIFVHPEDRDLALEGILWRFDEDSAIRPPIRVVTKSGATRWTEAVGTVIEYEGKPAILSCILDITEREMAQSSLRESEERYRSLFEETEDIILITTSEGEFLDINPAGVQFYGYSSKEELVDTLNARDTYVNTEDRERFQKMIAAQGFVKNYELALKRKNGEQRTALLTANAVLNEGGNVIAYRGIMRDITEQRQLQQQLIHAQKMESIGTLAGGIAHDFNNMLGGVLGYASLMKSKMRRDHPFYNYIDIIETSSVRAADLTAQLLAFARGGRYETEPVNLNRIIDETLKILGRTLDKSIDIETRLDSQLPTINADASQMQQMFMNLCVNAGDAMPGGGQLFVETSVETLTQEYADRHMGAEAGTYAVLSMTDTGIGMDQNTVSKVFEPFFTTKGEGEGTGLGLSMVYSVVKNHGGYITVYSEPNHGTTFKIYLPLSGEPETGEPSTLEMSPGGNNEVILVVDDEENIRSLARDMLESFGYRVLLAKDGEEAIEKYDANKDDVALVILDMVMPNMGGREAFLKIKEINSSVKALLSTGYSQAGKAQDILDSGVMGFIQKPYQLNSLLSKVRSVLDSDS